MERCAPVFRAPAPPVLFHALRNIGRPIVACLLGLFLFCAIGVAQQDIVTQIVIHGHRRIPAESVRARIFTRPGDIYDQGALERDFNSLWNTGYFEDIRFEREQDPKGWIIHVYVKERPTIREITYVGLSSVTNSDVLTRYKERKMGLTPESQYDPTKIKKAEVVLKELLAEHGKQFAIIRSEVRPIPPAAVGVTFVVKEGPKVKVGKIIFEGNTHISSRVLRGSMKNLRPVGIPHSIFLEGLFSKTYDATKLEEDTERARQQYQDLGYFKAAVQDPKTEIHDVGHTGFHIPLLMKGAGKVVDITLAVEEGDRYRLAKITFKNNKGLPNSVALRTLFPIKDGDLFSRAKIAKGLENLKNAYREYGYINFSPVPNTTFDEDKKTVNLEIDVDEGKQFFVRRIEFSGNTTTRDRVIRREVVLEEGQRYNERLWKYSLMRLNQLGYFEQLKPEDPTTTETHINEKEGTVDLTLKVKEKGKNSIGLTGGVSGLSGSFIGFSYSTNNFLGLGETLTVQANVGSLQKNIMFGFTEPYFRDRPMQLGFTVYTSSYKYDQAQQTAIATGQLLNLPSQLQNSLQNYTQSSSGFTTSVSYPLHRSMRNLRVGVTYSFDVSSITAVSAASKILFTDLAFRGISGPNSLKGIRTSKIVPSLSFNTVDAAYSPKSGSSFSIAAEIAGLGGTVRTIRPIVQYKHFKPMQNRRNTIGFNLQGSFMTGFGGVVAPPFERFYPGGEYDIRGFDFRSISPYALLPSKGSATLTNPDGSAVPLDPGNPLRGNYTIPIPVRQVVTPGGDFSLSGNVEYRITIAGPVTLAPFLDTGINTILRQSQLRINSGQLDDINNTQYGCPRVDPITFTCLGTTTKVVSQYLTPLSNTNWTPRMSTGIELQTMLPIVNAPFRIYWAYNLMRLNTTFNTNNVGDITRAMFPAGAAGDYTYQQVINTYASSNTILREPRKTFRFTVATTF